MRRAFTLTELMIVIAIIAIMAGLALSALSGANNLAKEHRTRVIIAKLDALINEKYEGYRTRQVPIRIPSAVVAANGPAFAAKMRLYALRDLMRMEMPERITDLTDGPTVLNTTPPIGLSAAPSQWQHYRRVVLRTCGANWVTDWSDTYQGAECLYLIIENMHDGDKAALDFFTSDEIGDKDGDKMKEILDGWGNPIEFLRWAPGYTRQNGANTTQDTTIADPFDPLKVDGSVTFLLRPLIFSPGLDKQYDIATKLEAKVGVPFHFSSVLNYPYYVPSAPQAQAGTPKDNDGDGISGDNITNHWPETP